VKGNPELDFSKLRRELAELLDNALEITPPLRKSIDFKTTPDLSEQAKTAIKNALETFYYLYKNRPVNKTLLSHHIGELVTSPLLKQGDKLVLGDDGNYGFSFQIADLAAANAAGKNAGKMLAAKKGLLSLFLIIANAVLKSSAASPLAAAGAGAGAGAGAAAAAPVAEDPTVAAETAAVEEAPAAAEEVAAAAPAAANAIPSAVPAENAAAPAIVSPAAPAANTVPPPANAAGAANAPAPAAPTANSILTAITDESLKTRLQQALQFNAADSPQTQQGKLFAAIADLLVNKKGVLQGGEITITVPILPAPTSGGARRSRTTRRRKVLRKKQTRRKKD
jgi:hypothetical protein